MSQNAGHFIARDGREQPGTTHCGPLAFTNPNRVQRGRYRELRSYAIAEAPRVGRCRRSLGAVLGRRRFWKCPARSSPTPPRQSNNPATGSNDPVSPCISFELFFHRPFSDARICRVRDERLGVCPRALVFAAPHRSPALRRGTQPPRASIPFTRLRWWFPRITDFTRRPRPSS